MKRVLFYAFEAGCWQI